MLDLVREAVGDFGDEVPRVASFPGLEKREELPEEGLGGVCVGVLRLGGRNVIVCGQYCYNRKTDVDRG